MANDEKLQKVLARAGVASRRTAEQWITEGRVSVNGEVAQIGKRVYGTEKITVDGRQVNTVIQSEVTTRVLLYHKPIGEIITRNDPQKRPTVFDNLPKLHSERWINVGRLDINTVGLLLLTNNGELAHRLMHPSLQIEREYAVRVLGTVTPEILQRLQQGVELEDGIARFPSIQFGGGEGANQWYHVTLTEGKNREVRRLWESQGLTVSRLIRIRYGSMRLPRDLPAGKWRELTADELAQLFQLAGIATPVVAPVDSAPVRRAKPQNSRRAPAKNQTPSSLYKSKKPRTRR